MAASMQNKALLLALLAAQGLVVEATPLPYALEQLENGGMSVEHPQMQKAGGAEVFLPFPLPLLLRSVRGT